MDPYCKKKYGAYLELPQFTDGRASKIVDYIRVALQQDDSVEIWNVWLLAYWEYEDRPYIRKGTIRKEELTADDIKETDILSCSSSNVTVGLYDNDMNTLYCCMLDTRMPSKSML